MTLKHMLAAVTAVVMIALSACTPQEVQIFRAATGYGPTTVKEANAICDEAFGVGSGDPGGECVRVATQIALERAQSSKPPGYRSFQSCREAVDYLFADRPDLSRAIRVVHRESRDKPSAVSRTGAKGCAQLTGGILTFLKGPWSDPYWNVLAMRLAVDNPKWGWCHWDIVNYCKAGGEF